MIKVEQTLLAPPEGNCFAACVASILELPIDKVPNYRSEGAGWWYEWQKWLKPRNLALLGWSSDDLGDPEVRADTLRGYSICTVEYHLPRRAEPLRHSCVALDGKIIWNPHPLRDTQQHDAVSDWIVFRVLDPAKPILCKFASQTRLI
jgi:hypothetical protein